MKVIRVVLAALVACGASIVAVPPALAFGGCAAGQIGLASGACVDLLTGSAKGGGSITSPQPLNKPGGVLAAANGEGGTVAQNAARAAANGTVKGVSMAARLGKVSLVGTAAYFGYWAGDNVVGPLLCNKVSDWFCKPTPDDSFVPNTDFVALDPGWRGQGMVSRGRTANGSAIAPVPITGSLGGSAYLLDFGPGNSQMDCNFLQIGAEYFNNRVQANGNVRNGLSGFGGGTVTYVGPSGGPGRCQWYKDSTQVPIPDFVAWYELDIGSPPSTVPGWLAAADGGTAILYSFPGGTYRPEDPDPNPARTMTTSIVCSSPSGPDVTVTATSAAFHETDAQWPQIPVPHCPSGSAPKQVNVTDSGPAGDKPIWDASVPPAVTNFQIEHPECMDGGCTLRLYRIGPAGSDLGDCFLQAGRCEGWFAEAEPQRSEDFECRYGLPGAMSVLPLSDCYVYVPTFDVQQQAKGIPVGDPATGDIPDSITDVTGDPGGDPTGDPSGDGGACWPSGWGVFNPLAWVYMPVLCALKAAFVPSSTAVQAQLQTTWETVRTRPPVSVVYPVVGFVTGFITNAGGTCGGAIADFGNGLVIPCQPPEGIAVFITILRWIISVLFAGYTAFVIWGMVEKSFSR